MANAEGAATPSHEGSWYKNDEGRDCSVDGHNVEKILAPSSEIMKMRKELEDLRNSEQKARQEVESARTKQQEQEARDS